MNKPLIGTAQHNDLLGTIALDARWGVTTTLAELAKLCNVPDDYYPVGFYLSGVRQEDGVADFMVAAIKGDSADVEKYIKEETHPNKKLIVRRFGGKINLNDLPKYFKMLIVAVVLKMLNGRKVEYDPSQDVEQAEVAE